MINVVVIYHSGHGHTAEQAKAVARGVDSASGVRATLITVSRRGDRGSPLGQPRCCRRDHIRLSDLYGQCLRAIQNLHGCLIQALDGAEMEG